VVSVHAGAGRLGGGIEEREAWIRVVLITALENAQVVLEHGRDATHAVRTAVWCMEGLELWSTSRGGAPVSSDGSVQLSAAIMRGFDRAAGAVMNVRQTKHPILAANGLLNSDQVMMVGDHADGFAAYMGAEQTSNSSFITERQNQRLHDDDSGADAFAVGAVCLDAHGTLAAATSASGIRGQQPGSVCDAPIIGAGICADAQVAVCCTGDREAFIRSGTARYVATLVELGTGLEEATERALREVVELGGRGGLIALDSRGGVSMSFATEAMPRGIWRAGQEPAVCVTQ
jgi:beta-aspartyl-peptidase (threonine type)